MNSLLAEAQQFCGKVKLGEVSRARLRLTGAALVESTLAPPFGPKAARVSHDSLRAQKNHKNSTIRHPERQKKNELGAGEGKKKAMFWAVRRRVSGGGVVWCRVVWRRVVQGSLNQPQPQQHQHRQKWRVEAKPRISVGSPLPGFRVWVFGVWAFWVQKIWPKH